MFKTYVTHSRITDSELKFSAVIEVGLDVYSNPRAFEWQPSEIEKCRSTTHLDKSLIFCPKIPLGDLIRKIIL